MYQRQIFLAVILTLLSMRCLAQPAGNSPGSISQMNNQVEITYFGIEGAGGAA